jgi:hypothetical protein
MNAKMKRKALLMAASFLTTILAWVLINRFLVEMPLWKYIVIVIGATSLNMPLETAIKKYYPEDKSPD